MVQVILPLFTDKQWGDPFYRPYLGGRPCGTGWSSRSTTACATETLLGWPRYYIEWHTMAAPQAAQNQVMSLIVQRPSSTASRS